MANGKEPKTTGEHIIALYGHISKEILDILQMNLVAIILNLKNNLTN